MNIIAQNGAIVNIYTEKGRQDITIATQKRLETARRKRAERQAEERKPTADRWKDHKAEAVKVGEALIKAGLNRRGWNIKMCGNELIFRYCTDCGHVEVVGAQLCRDRLCPLCGWRLAIKRYAAMQSIMAALYDTYAGCDYTLVTLTCRTCKPEALSETIKAMMKAWTACTYQKWARKAVFGWARSLECTYSSERGEIHPHYHILIMHAAGDGTPDKLISEWIKRCDKEGLIAVEAAQHADTVRDDGRAGESMAKTVCEVYKYMVKSKDTLAMPLSTLRTFAEQIAGFRLVAFGGCIRRIAKALGEDDLDTADENENVAMCTRCKSQAVDDIIARWSVSGQAYYTMQGMEVSEYLHGYEDTTE